MPNNRREGALEDFLIDLIHPTDLLLGATNQAQKLGAAFPVNATRKAELRALGAKNRGFHTVPRSKPVISTMTAQVPKLS